MTTAPLPGLTPDQLAELLGKTSAWVVRNGPRLPHHRIGRSVRYFPDDVAEILALTKQRPDAAADPDDDLRPLPSRRRPA